MRKVKKTRGGGSRRTVAKEEEEKLLIPCSTRSPKRVAGEEEEKNLLIPSSSRRRKEVATEIDKDVTTNILTRIPADLLHDKFMHQCREWFHILAGPEFIDTNTLHSKAGLIFIMSDATESRDEDMSETSEDEDMTETSTRVGFLEFEGLDFKVRELNVFKTADMKFLSSCRGLVLVQVRPQYEPDLFVLNPATEESVAVPPCGHKCLWHELVYVPITKEYKLVDMFYENSTRKLAFHIRSVGGRWNESYHVCNRGILKNVRIIDSYRDKESGALWNQRISIGGVVYVNLSRDKKIISFDLFNDMVQILELPAALGQPVRLIELGGSLAFVHSLANANDFPLDVWHLNNMGVWEKNFRIDSLPERGHYFSWRSVVGTLDGGQVLLFASSNEIYAYDVKPRRWKFTIVEDHFFGTSPCIHVNSLVHITKVP